MMETLENQIIRHEGMEHSAYQDSRGYWTIGIGRMIDKRLKGGISKDEAIYLLKNDLKQCKKELDNNFDFFYLMDATRKNVLINMCFNLGISRLKRFKRMIAAIRKCDWEQAAKEMKDSRWSRQVGARAQELSLIMETGRFNNG